MKSEKPNKICVLGLWHLGLVSAAVLADLGYPVIGLDSKRGLINDLRQARLPLFEPGLEDLIRIQLRTGQLRFEVDYERTIAESKTVLIAYDTPVDDQDHVDLTLLNQAVEAITPHLVSDALVLINSQVPVGSCERWQGLIRNRRPGTTIDVVYSPENLRLGQAIPLFKQPDLIVIGSNSESARKKAEAFYAPFSSDKFFVSWRTAEMAKHALNAFFATSISFANEIGNLCDAVGADGIQIAEILKKDSRIGKKAQVRPGLGFAGGTLARDLRALQNLGRKYEVPMALVDSVLDINQRQIKQIVTVLAARFQRELRKKTLTIFGLTYKPGTSTLRRSASLEIIQRLRTKGVTIRAHDPKADLSECPKEYNSFACYPNPYEACQGSHGIVLLTEWPEYRDLDYERIKGLMANPLIFDLKNHLDGNRIKQLGFAYLELGRGQLDVKR